MLLSSVYCLQIGRLNGSLQQVQLSAASSLQKRQIEISRLDSAVKSLESDLSEARRRIKSLEQDILQKDDQLAQTSGELRASREENILKLDEVRMH
jgi:peptidoglycan hydrolase CwlO-like protein